ncbi:MAG TPA: phosphatidylserine decarboxylase [Candidatus Thermoplasmatota archaeon]|nr:phosphatidylserine decarboxylase [Candidatus Thermoplasmatota archaeon]
MIRIAKGGRPWVLPSFALTFLFAGACYFTTRLLFIFFCALSIFFFLVSCLLIVFFRDPERVNGSGIVAVADGKIRAVMNLQDPDVGECLMVSTFMNIHNVHVNRMPFDGTIEKLSHYDGGHLPAFKKESDSNERVVLLIHTDLGVMKIVQIAGTVARRIVPYVTEGAFLKKGGKIGLIRLGSRVDLYLPVTTIKTLMIQVHDTIKAGEDTIAETHD